MLLIKGKANVGTNMLCIYVQKEEKWINVQNFDVIFGYWREFQKTFITFVTPKIANHTHNITAPHYQHKLFDQSY